MPRPSDAEILADVDEQIGEQPPPRCTILAVLRQLVGGPELLSYQNPHTRDAYVTAIYFFGIFPQSEDNTFPSVTAQQKAQAYGMAAVQSSCGLVTEIGWRAAGVDDPALYQFYFDRVQHGKYAVAEERNFAIKTGAWVDGGPWVEGTPLPGIGDAVIIGLSSDPNYTRGGGFSGEHEFTVVSYLGDPPPGVTYVHSIDGGQSYPSAGGSQTIKLCTRAFAEVWTGTNAAGQRTGELWACQVNADGSVPRTADGRPVVGRRVVGYADVSKLPLMAPLPPCTDGGPEEGEGPGRSGLLRSALEVAGGIAGGLLLWWAVGKPLLRETPI